MKAVLSFLRIIDADAKLSLTNLLLVAGVGRVMAGEKPGVADFVFALGTVANYAVKKVLEHTAPRSSAPETADVTRMQAQIDELKNKISSLSMAAGMRPMPPRR